MFIISSMVLSVYGIMLVRGKGVCSLRDAFNRNTRDVFKQRVIKCMCNHSIARECTHPKVVSALYMFLSRNAAKMHHSIADAHTGVYTS